MREYAVEPESRLYLAPAAHARAVAARAADASNDDKEALEEALDAHPPGRTAAPSHRWRSALVHGGLAIARKRAERALCRRGSSPEEAAEALDALGLTTELVRLPHSPLVCALAPGKLRV